MRSGLTLVAVTAAAVFALSRPTAHLTAASPAPAQDKRIPSSEASIKRGATVYARTCRPCHGLSGKGDGIAAPPGSKPANLVDAEWKHGSKDEEIFKVIHDGIKPYDVMEPWGKILPTSDIWHLVNYIRSLAAKK
jgi:mono/diheme cytochrome c family protein